MNVPTIVQVTREAVLGEVAKLAFANMHDYMRFQGSVATVDFSRLTRDQAAAITEVTVTTRQERAKEGGSPAEVTNLKFKLADKRQALLALGRHLGLFADASAPLESGTVRPDFNDPKARLELAREILFLITEAKDTARAPVPCGAEPPLRSRASSQCDGGEAVSTGMAGTSRP